VFRDARRVARRRMGGYGKTVCINWCEEGEREGKRDEGMDGGAPAGQRRSRRRDSDHCGGSRAKHSASTTWETRIGIRNGFVEGERRPHIRTVSSDPVVSHETCDQNSGSSTTPDAPIFIDDIIAAWECGQTGDDPS